MIENVRKVEADRRGNEELQKKLFEELVKIAKEKSAESDAKAMAKAAQSLGYDFTVADMEKAHAEAREPRARHRIARYLQPHHLRDAPLS